MMHKILQSKYCASVTVILNHLIFSSLLFSLLKETPSCFMLFHCLWCGWYLAEFNFSLLSAVEVSGDVVEHRAAPEPSRAEGGACFHPAVPPLCKQTHTQSHIQHSTPPGNPLMTATLIMSDEINNTVSWIEWIAEECVIIEQLHVFCAKRENTSCFLESFCLCKCQKTCGGYCISYYCMNICYVWLWENCLKCKSTIYCVDKWKAERQLGAAQWIC